MKRVALVLQVTLAVLLTVLWLCWNPISSECGNEGSDCGESHVSEAADVFSVAERDDVDVSPSPVDPMLSTRLEVEYSGCAMVTSLQGDDVECIYEPGSELRVWVVHSRIDEVVLEIDGRRWTTTEYRMPEEFGKGFRGIVIGESHRRLTVHAPSEEPWELRLRASSRLTPLEQATLSRRDELAPRLEHRAIAGDTSAASDSLEFLDELVAAGLLSRAVEHGLAMSFHFTWQVGRLDLGERLCETIRPWAKRYPRGSAMLAVYDGHVKKRQGRLVDAAKAYRRGGRFAVRMADDGLQFDALSIYALVLSELGYFEAAAYWGGRAVTHARERGDRTSLVNILSLVAYVNLQLRKSGQAHEEPEPAFREAMRLATDAKFSNDVEVVRYGLAELAVVDGDYDAAARHLDALNMTMLTSELVVKAHNLQLDTLLATGASPGDARAVLHEMRAAALWESAPSVRWLAAVRQGDILEQEGNLKGAQDAYERAEDLLDRVIPLGLLGAQGEATPARRREGTQRLVSLLLRRHQPDRALCVLRQAQARVGQLARLFPRLDREVQGSLRGRVEGYLEAKRAYEALLRSADDLPAAQREQARREAARRHEELDRDALEILATRAGYQGRPSCDELNPRQDGELLLGLYPHGDDLLVLAQDDGGTTHRVISGYESLSRSDNAEWFGSVLLDPLDERLAASSQIRVLASGEAAAIDVHALPWREQPLVEQRPVVYGLDLPPQDRPAVPEGATSALVVADVLADGTEHEVADVEARLLDADWSVERSRSDEHRADAIREKVSQVDHFHYAGHAYYDIGGIIRRAGQRAAGGGEDDDDEILRLWPPYPGGAAAEPSYIKLGRSGRLDVQDILMMTEVPRSVVLMGCSTGVNDERMAYGGFSLATAFLGAGTQMVVASTREVDGKWAALLGRGLYADFGPRGVEEPGQWFMAAVRWARDNGLPAQAIRDYRVFVP